MTSESWCNKFYSGLQFCRLWLHAWTSCRPLRWGPRPLQRWMGPCTNLRTGLCASLRIGLCAGLIPPFWRTTINKSTQSWDTETRKIESVHPHFSPIKYKDINSTPLKNVVTNPTSKLITIEHLSHIVEHNNFTNLYLQTMPPTRNYTKVHGKMLDGREFCIDILCLHDIS